MKVDGKIKKALKKDLQPTKTFDAFCAENGVSVQKSAPARSSLWKKLAIPLAAAVVLCVALPIALTSGGGDVPQSVVVKQYNVGKEVTKVVAFSELKSDPDLVLYDPAYEQYNSYSAFLCSEDDDILLAYVVKSVVYGGQVDGTLYAYSFDFLARCYDGYAADYSLVLDGYKQTGNAFVCDGVSYYYGIVNGNDGASAVICYENGKYDYFIRLRLVLAGSTINDNDVKDFIRLAFDTQKEKL